MLNIDDVLKLLPHRFPMLMVDEVSEIEPMEYAKGIKAVTYNEPYFRAHFPQKPVMPGVFIIEALAQLIHIVVVTKEEYKDKLCYYAKISKAKYFDTVRPGAVLELSVKKKAQAGELVSFNVIASVKGNVVFSGEITTMITE